MRVWMYKIERIFFFALEVYKIRPVCIAKRLNRKKKFAVFWPESAICSVVCISIKLHDLLYCLLLLVIKAHAANFSGHKLDAQSTIVFDKVL